MHLLLASPGLIFGGLDPSLKDTYHRGAGHTREYIHSLQTRLLMIVGSPTWKPNEILKFERMNDEEYRKETYVNTLEICRMTNNMLSVVSEVLPALARVDKTVLTTNLNHLKKMSPEPDPSLTKEYLMSEEGKPLLLFYLKTMYAMKAQDAAKE